MNTGWLLDAITAATGFDKVSLGFAANSLLCTNNKHRIHRRQKSLPTEKWPSDKPERDWEPKNHQPSSRAVGQELL